jgi:hypothetical protein
MVGLAGEGLRSVGVLPIDPIQERVLYPAHRSPFTGRGSLQWSTPARTSLLKPAADQQVQPLNDRQGAYHRQRCEYPEEHSEHALTSLACCRVQQSRYPR